MTAYPQLIVLAVCAVGASGGFFAAKGASEALFRKVSQGQMNGGCLTLLVALCGGAAGVAATLLALRWVIGVFG